MGNSGSTIELPSCETIRDRVHDGTDGQGVNLLARPLDDRNVLEDVERESADDEETTRDTYVGDDAAWTGLLAAAATVAADEDARLHYPKIDRTAPGPWLVLAPLSGRVGTVVRGHATVTIVLDRQSASDLENDEARLSAVLEAARPQHEHYPVADDGGTFTTGMTTFSLADVSVGDEMLSIVLDVETTPATTATAVRDRFTTCSDVREVRFERHRTVERASPDDPVRKAIEAAQVSVRGDWDYTWLPSDSPVALVPDSNKLALGTGVPGEPFDVDDFETCRNLLERTVTTLEESR